ncbi:DNA-binding protein [Sphingomonas naasensis]|uniref:DNA-binding protein n=1 Tax=Sphingomonas naasensis TaxID=1344951 RepID=A0A4S1WTG0_9SPHN|nr:DNA-binding protein [Sphingomonas naasensis]
MPAPTVARNPWPSWFLPCWQRFSTAIASSPRHGGAASRRRAEMGERLLSVEDAAAFLKVHANTVRAWVRSGRIPGAKIGRGWRFIEADLVAVTREGYSAPARMQPSAFHEEAIWHSGTVQESITSSSQHRTERALDVLLERPTGRRPRNITTS